MFECQLSRKCLNISLMCNNVIDCEDRSDEGSMCDEHHDEIYEFSLPKRPDADTDRMNPNCTLEVTEGCRCNNQTNLYCENSFLHVPFPISVNVTFLDLSGNEIHVIHSNDLGRLPHLTKLIMVDSAVRVIEPAALFHLPSLREIHLTHNMLTRVPGHAFSFHNDLTTLNLRNNHIAKLLVEDLQTFSKLRSLYLQDNYISYIQHDALCNLPQLKDLDLSGNQLGIIKNTFFQCLPHLQQLYLNQNGVSYIEPASFYNLSTLRALNLRDNELRHIASGTFTGLKKLSILQLENNGIQTIDTEAFQPLTTVHSVLLAGNQLRGLTNKTFSPMKKLHYIYFDKFYLCVYAQHAEECEPRGDGISSQYNLLENLFLRVCVWLVALLSCLGNLLVFLGRFLLREDNQIHSFFIKNLSLADLLMGIYLLVIAAQDLKFRGNYLLFDETWRHSRECDLCGVLSTLSTEMSVLTLCIITLDRYLSIMYPLSFRKRGLKVAYGVMTLTWLLCLTLALLPVLGLRYFGASFYRDNGVCVPLHLHDPKAKGWEYSSFLFLGVNLASFAFIAYAYCAMFWSIHRSAIPLRTSRESKERCLVKRFFFIVITDFLCWIPIIIIKVIALSGVSVSKDLYAWVIVFILPVNSALNPLLYTLTTKLFKQTLLSKFTSVVFRPGHGKGDKRSSGANGRRNGFLHRKAPFIEVELQRRHRPHKSSNSSLSSGRDGRETHTSTTPLTSSPASQYWSVHTLSPTHGQGGLDLNGGTGANQFAHV